MFSRLIELFSISLRGTSFSRQSLKNTVKVANQYFNANECSVIYSYANIFMKSIRITQRETSQTDVLKDGYWTLCK